MLGSIIGGIVGNIAGGGDRRAARDALSEAIAAYKNIKVPTIEDQKILLEKFKEAGVLSPEVESAINLGPSEMEQVSTDPKLKDAQMAALEQLQDLGQKGLSLQDRAALNEMRNDVARDTQARQESILQNMAQRGISGSGQELAAQLQASQSGANRQSEQGDRTAAMAQMKALESISQAGNLGGQIRGQDFNEQSAKARAADEIKRFNVTNQQAIQQRNVAARNAAQAANLQNRQDVMNKNTGISNTQETHNKGLYQQQFDNEMAKARGLSGALTGQANASNAEAARKGQMWSSIGQGVDEGFGGAAEYLQNNKGGSLMNSAGMFALLSDQTEKKKIKPTSDSKFSDLLNNIKSYDYEYKDKEHGEGEHTSVMAQDLEKSELGKKMVINTPEGKMVDYGKGFATMLAAQSSLNKRLESLEKKKK